MAETLLQQHIPRCDRCIEQFRKAGHMLQQAVDSLPDPSPARSAQQYPMARYQQARTRLLNIHKAACEFRHPEDKLDNWDFIDFIGQLIIKS